MAETDGRGKSGLSAFLADERGAITTDLVLILLPIILIILTVFEIGVSYYFVLAAQKAAQMGARFIVAETPIHAALQGNPTYEVNFANGQVGDSCSGTSGAKIPIATSGSSPCRLTHISPAWEVVDTRYDKDGNPYEVRGWQCDPQDANFATNCDSAAFTELVDEMRIVYPSLREDEVVVTYSEEGLGFAGGPIQPMITVTIIARDSPIRLLSLLDLLWSRQAASSNLGPDPEVRIEGVQEASAKALRRVSASVFGADLSSTNVRN